MLSLMKSHSNQQVSLANAALIASYDETQSGKDLCVFCGLFCSGGSEAQCLVLDEQFHECYAETQCKQHFIV